MLARFREAKLMRPLLTTLVGLAILLSLGIWQMSRKAWKEDLIAKLEARSSAAAVPLSDAVKRFGAGEDIEYLRVTAKGRLLHDKERYFYAPSPERGSGVNVYTPLDASGAGGIVFVNRGFVPDALKDPAKRAAGQLNGEIEVTGLVRKAGIKANFIPENDPQKNLWHWRDLDGLVASAFGTAAHQHVPFFIDAEASAAAQGDGPKGGATLARLSNRHLEYALTWFGLAAALLSIFVIYARARLSSL
jgi:surfeit locus 1 family protein